MRILVIGLGGCGSRIADEFSRLNGRARSKRGFEIITGAFAVSADAEDLIGLTSIKADYRHRILIGAEHFHGGGIDRDNELGARVMKEHAASIVEEIREVRQFFETDAVLLVGSASGGTGSGGLPVMVQRVKQRFPEKAVYAMVVLPFQREEEEDPVAVENTAVCLKSVSSVADAVILADNECCQIGGGGGDFSTLNQAMTEPFYNLLCAGAEKRKKHIGIKLLDAGDIIQTLGGWTVIGGSRTDLPMGLASILPGGAGKPTTDTSRGIRAMDKAIGEVSRICRPRDAATALYLVSAPAEEISLDLMKELGDYLKGAAPSAIIRSGDYPVGRGVMEVTVVFSQLNDVARVRRIYTRSVSTAAPVEEETTPAESGPSSPESDADPVPDAPDEDVRTG